MNTSGDAPRDPEARDWDYVTVGLLFNPVNRLLAPILGRLGIHPNLITVASFLAAGAAGALWLAPGRYGIWASALLIVSFWLDGLDGHVARGTGKTSRWGGALDAILDRLGECLVLGCVSAGAWLELGTVLWPFLGIAAISMVQVYYYEVDRFLVPSLAVKDRALVPVARRLRPGLMEVYYVVLAGFGLAGRVHLALPVICAAFGLGFVVQLVRIRIAAGRADG